MKWITLCMIALTTLTQSCGVNDTEIIDYNPNITNPIDTTTTLEYFYNEYCYGYKVKDTTALTVMGKSQKRPNTDIDIKEGTTYLSGTRNGKLWIAGFETATKEQTFEFIDSKPMEQKCKLHLGYGEYKNITINSTDVEYIIDKSPNIISRVKVYSKFETSYFYAAYTTFYTPSSSKTYLTQVNYEDPIEWYNNTYLFHGLNINKPYDSNVYSCMNQKGDTIFTHMGSRFFYAGRVFPINNKDVIFFASNQIEGKPSISISKENIDLENASSAWKIVTPIAYWLDDAKYSITKKEISGNIWLFTIDLLWRNGEKGSYSYKININMGELIINE